MLDASLLLRFPKSLQGLPPLGINVVAAQLHTHLAGVAAWVEHSRGGASLGEIARDNHFSTHFQEIRRLPQEVNIRPVSSQSLLE